MNEKGAQAKAATALGLYMMAAPGSRPVTETLIVDKPFLVWIERPGVSMPIFADYMLKQYWSNPGELPE
jgi:serine protease inhibitor